ncbi:MAG TPA: hypothetical protein VK446_11725 [Methylocystis sp.]|nr:hypothetical protein [Methylocystis sp.]
MRLSSSCILVGLLCAGAARAESVALSCQIASKEGPSQDLSVEIANGRVRYGSGGSALVEAQSISGFSMNGGSIAFRQNFPSERVVWDWTIDRASGAITIKYVNTANSSTFLTKRGTCR